MARPTSGSTGSLPEEDLPEKFTFFSDMSLFELAFGIGSTGVNCLCVGMMLNIPTLALHSLMYNAAPKGLLNESTTDQERIGVAKAIIDHWMGMTEHFTPKKRFKQIYKVFLALKEKEIAEALKAKFEANDCINLEIFSKFDLQRLGPYVPPVEETEVVEAEGEEEEESDED